MHNEKSEAKVTSLGRDLSNNGYKYDILNYSYQNM